MSKYNDKMSADRQITMEEKIAARVFSSMHGDAAAAGRDILKMVLAEFRADLFMDNVDPEAEAVQRVLDAMKKHCPEGMHPDIHLWDDAGRNLLVGVRVSECGFSSDRAGTTYMQSDIPWGLAICAQVERCIIAHLDVDRGEAEIQEEMDRLDYALRTDIEV